ncbi:MAG: hypothetical protein ABJB03_08810 [Rhodoglobus sp.]
MTTKRLPMLLLAASALVLAGCAPTPATTAAPTPSESSIATPTPAPTEAPPTATPTAGDCTAADSDSGGTAAVYTVFSDDSTTPITLSYTAFNRADAPVITETVYGPMVTRVGYPCNDTSNQAPWTFTATSSSGGALACVLAFGGKLVKTDSQYNEGATTPMTADCTGHPGM